MGYVSHPQRLIGLVALHGITTSCLFGCYGDVQGVSVQMLGNSTPLPASFTCSDKIEGETVQGVDPQGGLWVWDGSAKARRIGLTQQVTEVNMPSEQLFPVNFSDSARAVFGGEDVFWITGQDVPEALYVPEDVGAIHVACGDPQLHFPLFVLGDDAFFRAEAGEWFRLEGQEGFDRLERFYHVDNGCITDTQTLWAQSGSRLRKVDIAQASIDLLEGLPETQRFALDRWAGFALLSDESLYSGLGEPDPGTIDQHRVAVHPSQVISLSQGGGYIWIATVSGLYLRDATQQWQKLSFEMDPGVVQAVWAHAVGGAWVETDLQYCHVDAGHTIRVFSVLSFAKYRSAKVDLRVRGPEGTQDVQVATDFVQLHSITEQDDGSWLEPDYDLGEVGWHELQIQVLADGRWIERRLLYEVY